MFLDLDDSPAFVSMEAHIVHSQNLGFSASEEQIDLLKLPYILVSAADYQTLNYCVSTIPRSFEQKDNLMRDEPQIFFLAIMYWQGCQHKSPMQASHNLL